MSKSGWQIVLAGLMGLGVAACGTFLSTRQAPPAKVIPLDATEVNSGPATRPEPPVVVDVDHPFMKWGELRPDPGRARPRTDPTAFWSDAKAVEHKLSVPATVTPADRQAIPRPIEPASIIGSAPVLPEPADLAIPAKSK